VSVKSARMISELADELERIQEEPFVAQKRWRKWSRPTLQGGHQAERIKR